MPSPGLVAQGRLGRVPGRLLLLPHDLGLAHLELEPIATDADRKGLDRAILAEMIEPQVAIIDDDAFVRRVRKQKLGRQGDQGLGAWDPRVDARVDGRDLGHAEIALHRDVEQRLVTARHVVGRLADQVAGPELCRGTACRHYQRRQRSSAHSKASAGEADRRGRHRGDHLDQGIHPLSRADGRRVKACLELPLIDSRDPTRYGHEYPHLVGASYLRRPARKIWSAFWLAAAAEASAAAASAAAR